MLVKTEKMVEYPELDVELRSLLRIVAKFDVADVESGMFLLMSVRSLR